MIHFIRVSHELKEECHLVVLHDNMNISCLMVNEEQVDDTRSKIKSRDAKKARSFDGGKEYA